MSDSLPTWPRQVAIAAIVGVGASMLAAVVGQWRGVPPFHLALGGVFFCFAALKYAVAMESVLRLRAVRAGRPDPRDLGQVQVSWPMVVYKLVACVTSIFAGIYVLTSGAAAVDRLVAG